MKKMLAEAKVAILNNPVEVLLSAIFCLFGCFYNEVEDGGRVLESVIRYFPVFFLAANILNRLTREGAKALRVLYYLSAVAFVPFLWVNLGGFTATYVVSLVVVQLLYLIGGWKRENDAFVESGIRYLMAMLSALFLAGAAWVLSMSIYYSIRYIFEIWQGGESDFIRCIVSVLYLGVAPLLFLMFGEKKEYGDVIRNNKLLEVLLNYVLSPALLVYGVILSLYFLKIAVQWSLPKGDVAYIVVSFTTAAFVLRGCQGFLARRYYDWFYKRISVMLIPALAMYWVGTCYRINQYGYTEPRVYLVVVGAILTAVAVLFLSQRWGRYLYAACLAAGLLSAVTYVPGVTAGDIEKASQLARGNCTSEGKARETVWNVQYDGPVDIEGFRTVQPLGCIDRDAVRLSVGADSLYIYEGARLVYAESEKKFLERQFAGAGLGAECDSIPKAAYPRLLRLEMDSATVVFDYLVIERDTAYSVGYLNGGMYLKRN